jgi:hypothetical protein
MDPVGEAIKNLRVARDEALARLAAIDRSLLALDALADVSRPLSDLPGKQTIAAAILRLLKSQGGEWNADSIVRALREENYDGLNEADPVPAVRTALSRLARRGLLLKPSYGFYMHPDAIKNEAYDLAVKRPSSLVDRELIEEARSLVPEGAYDPEEEPF